MESLTDKEKIEAWNSVWYPSFDGLAIVNQDFTFRDVNPQWLDMLGITPAELIGKSFTDITPIEVRELDIQNAKLTIDGVISTYMMHKEYEFQNGTSKKVALLVTRVPKDTRKPFQFFLSRIMLEEEAVIEDILPQKSNQWGLISRIVNFSMQYGMWFVGIGTIIGAIALEVWKAM